MDIMRLKEKNQSMMGVVHIPMMTSITKVPRQPAESTVQVDDHAVVRDMEFLKRQYAHVVTNSRPLPCSRFPFTFAYLAVIIIMIFIFSFSTKTAFANDLFKLSKLDSKDYFLQNSNLT